MTLEELDKVLTHPNITILSQAEIVGLCRDRVFVIDNMVYHIEWWCNAIYLRHCGVLVAADRVEQSGTWPNRARLNLQFTMRGTTVCVIELEKHKEIS